MNWKKIKNKTEIIDMKPIIMLGQTMLEFKIEIQHKPYLAYYFLEDEKENYLGYINHDQNKSYFCPYCGKRSQEEKSCPAFNHKQFEEILETKSQEMIEKIQDEAEEGMDSIYETYTKSAFKEAVKPMHVVYVKGSNSFIFDFYLFDKGNLFAPYILVGIEPTIVKENDITFVLKNAAIVHNEWDVFEFDDGETIEDFICGCGFEYNRERVEKGADLLTCADLSEEHFKYWISEVFESSKDFNETLYYAYQHPIDEQTSNEKKENGNVVQLSEFKKKKE